MIRPIALFLVLAATAQLSGCSNELAYNTLQAAGRQQCLQQPPSEQADCEARLNKDDYATYTKQREADQARPAR